MAKYTAITVICLFVANTLGAPLEETNFESRIVGGEDAKEGAYPYQVSLRELGEHVCGGAIVHPNWVVTAAHCVLDFERIPLTVKVGTNLLNEGGIEYKVRAVYIHEGYNDLIIKNDTALLEVDTITLTDRVSPVIVDTNFVDGGEHCITTGWGTTSTGGQLPETLQELKLSTITYEDCKERAYPKQVHDRELCTFTSAGQGLCHGDSGGPLVRIVNGIHKLIGTTSWATRPCAKGYPDVFTRISSFVPWLNEKCHNCLNQSP